MALDGDRCIRSTDNYDYTLTVTTLTLTRTLDSRITHSLSHAPTQSGYIVGKCSRKLTNCAVIILFAAFALLLRLLHADAERDKDIIHEDTKTHTHTH